MSPRGEERDNSQCELLSGARPDTRRTDRDGRSGTGSLVMERKMLRTIKQYAEALSRERDVGGALSS